MPGPIPAALLRQILRSLAIICAGGFSQGFVAMPPLASAADLPPVLVGRFTRQVQPLLLNKCAAGACHGGPTAHAPQFSRGDLSGTIDRSVTLANIDTLARAIEISGDVRTFLKTISSRHPAAPASVSLTMEPLTPPERATLEHWLVAAAGSQPAAAAAASPTATARIATPHSQNRFRAMLDAAANPMPLPPPQEPQGIILGKDSEE